jgi:hypothetical protein
MPSDPRTWALRLALVASLPLASCAKPPSAAPEPQPAARSTEPAPEVYRRADAARMRILEHEVQRLSADVRSAEETLIAVESGLRGAQTQAAALSTLAEARIQVDRAEKRAPWRAESATEARAKLEEADRQLAAGHVASAIFFASRASRIAQTLLAEADLAAKSPGTRFVRSGRVNLRAEPNTESEVVAVLPADVPVFSELDEGPWMLVRTVTGHVGWLRSDLVRAR